MRESDFTRTVIDIARTYKWKVSHFLPAPTAKGWRTPVQGDIGFPDLALARDGVLLLAELKARRGKLRPEQIEWRDAIGPEHYRLWYPGDLPAIVAELR
jgi:hypothetical protein